jgi:hypothetical protein
MVKNAAPDDEATLNGLRTVDDDDWMLNANVEEVALIPATVPLSMLTPEPRVVGDVQRVRRPVVPPDTEAVIPSDEVATHRVDVPVDQST